MTSQQPAPLSSSNFFLLESSRRKTKVFFLLSFSDLSHHRTCRSAYGGAYFGFHSRYESIRHIYPCLRNLSFDIAVSRIGLCAVCQYARRVFPHWYACHLAIPHLMRFFTLVFGFFQAFHIHIRILRLNHLSVSRQRRLISAR